MSLYNDIRKTINNTGSIELAHKRVLRALARAALGQQPAAANQAVASLQAGAETLEYAIDESGDIVTTKILIDLTGLTSTNTDLDIIGVDASTDPAYIIRAASADLGTVWGGRITCLELPAGGDPNIALYSAVEGTGIENGGIAALTETLLYDPAADWAAGASAAFVAPPTDGGYLYLVQGDAVGTAAAYTAGRFLIELYGKR